MTPRDRLFLLSPQFADPKAGPGLWHCPECVQVEGLLASYPFLRGVLEVSYVDFPRPRAAIVPLVGAENQGCPVLILAGAAPEGLAVQHHHATGRNFVSGYRAIAAYLSAVHRVPAPHP